MVWFGVGFDESRPFALNAYGFASKAGKLFLNNSCE